MKIPNQVKILGHDIVIRYEDTIKLDKREESGIASFTDGTILLARQCHDLPISEDVKAETFIHEVLHFVNEAMTMGLTEKQVHRVARGIYAFIKDNNFLSEE